ncbi:MAG TPA: DUF1003 domain-containing protein [Candidatus Bathyarchaeia archaeon]|nr:DUF1003 domain-containing protein [Candidatus Bathyarchaeia archaeon]
MKLQFPEPYAHKHPPVRNVNDLLQEHLTPGQRASDQIARIVGSWTFIITQSILLVFWVALNVMAWISHWDPYPFILLNLFLSLQAAYTAPIIMMSQNRLAARDRLEAHEDYHTNLKAEEEIRAIMNHLAAQDTALTTIHDILVGLQEKPAA